ncbi:hypothetical protein FSARC_5056 [Fusarium sarcochroum]|uniref:F-box domain-containing protein n=1 Tax=Fusarium sarcochroum TaxID=1208366 RepID=A0A8H4U0B0_9HYPO|nr:hypothetical protein FSARC_5056 [Fusarium sarcochroum]
MVPHLMPKLPIEIQCIILSLVPQLDLLSIRQVSEGWFHAEVIDQVISTSLGTVSIMFERQSLESFLQICEIPNFASQIRILDICIRHLLPLDNQQRSGDANDDGEDEDVNDGGHTYATCTSGYCMLHLREQDELMRNYTLLKRFSEGLQKLTQCGAIVFADEEPPRGFCGLAEGVDPSHYRGVMLKPGESIAFVSKVLHVVLDGPVRPHLEAIDFNIGEFSSRNMDGIKPSMLPSLPSAVANVRRLSLHLDCESLDGSELGTFIQGFPELLELGLTIVGDDWMLKTLPFLNQMAIPQLQKLCLTWLACGMHELETFLIRHRENFDAY